ncbi:proteasome-domain-containing protein [Calocera viscosa TUFC12733]|uniref:Proteasome-domain-containing protein n=1 Tax=Calocera viscosa (strain TUFC12733) TaxID=1330018 RepID=A0A167I1E2_CALVF|nr:proteasome-domain-containing protein [Calocera viscosa TUFC12733]
MPVSSGVLSLFDQRRLPAYARFSNFMRQQAMSSRMTFNRPVPVNRLVSAIADRAQVNTQEYGRRPYGVGLLVIGQDQSGPHLYEFSPAGNSYEYFAMSIGARSQSAKTYLEKHFEEFEGCSLEDLVRHGLHALRETLQQDKELTIHNTSIGILGPAGVHEQATAASLGKEGVFRILEGDVIQPYLDSMLPKEVPAPLHPAASAAAATPAAEAAPPAPAPAPEEMPGALPADDDVNMD